MLLWYIFFIVYANDISTRIVKAGIFLTFFVMNVSIKEQDNLTFVCARVF